MKSFCILFLVVIILSGCDSKKDRAYIVPEDYSPAASAEASSAPSIEDAITLTMENAEDANIDENITNGEYSSWLEDYDGNWEVTGLLGYFFYSDPINLDYVGTELSICDKFIGLNFSINAENQKLTLDGDEIYELDSVFIVSSDELARRLFAPNWSVVGQRLAREICGVDYYEAEGYYPRRSEGNPVKFLVFENTVTNERYHDYLAIVVADNGDLLLNVRDGGGTYILSQFNWE